MNEVIKEQERLNKIDALPLKTLFYVQVGYRGDAVLWAGELGKIKTTDINRAGLFTKLEVKENFINFRVYSKFKIWPYLEVVNNITKSVKIGNLNQIKSI